MENSFSSASQPRPETIASVGCFPVAPQTPATVEESRLDLPEPYKKALLLWLQWNDAYEQITARMYKSREDQQALQELLDQFDHLRNDAVRLSRHVLD